MSPKKKFLFNFAVSYSGGGHKRLYEYAKWFNKQGGAWFVIHPNCAYLKTEFPNNHFFIVYQNTWERLCKDCAYLEEVKNEMGKPDFYYAYGIPIYQRFGKINWFHLSNVLPLALKGIPLGFFERLKLMYLGWRIRRNFCNANFLSAESNYSLSVIGKKHGKKLLLSVNGGDDELDQIRLNSPPMAENFAVIVGTYRYKALDHALKVFEMLKQSNPDLRLRVIGNEKSLPADFFKRDDVLVMGLLKRVEVIEFLRKSKYYISMTHIENSYNAASEGLFLAEESLISDIAPHRELLEGAVQKRLELPGIGRAVLHVIRTNALGENLRTWDAVISDMVNHVENSLVALAK